MHGVLLSMCVCGVSPLPWADPPAAESGPRALIERAVKAHGGAEKLERLRAMQETTRGTLHVAGQTLPFQYDTLLRLPDQFRIATTTDVGGKKLTVIHTFDGKNGWTRENDITSSADEPTISSWRETAHANQVASLLPLLAADKGYIFADLGASDVNGKPARGVRIAFKGRRDVSLWFDRETGLLVKKSYQPREKGGGAVQDEVYSAFKEFEGVKRPTRVQISLNQMLHADITVERVRFLERVDDREFAKP